MSEPKDGEWEQLTLPGLEPAPARLNPYVDEDAIRLLRDPEADPCDLTYALERLNLLPSAEAMAVALRCSKHPDAIVREGLVYGLGALLDLDERPWAERVLTAMSDDDESRTIRNIAREALE